MCHVWTQARYGSIYMQWQAADACLWMRRTSIYMQSMYNREGILQYTCDNNVLIVYAYIQERGMQIQKRVKLRESLSSCEK